MQPNAGSSFVKPSEAFKSVVAMISSIIAEHNNMYCIYVPPFFYQWYDTDYTMGKEGLQWEIVKSIQDSLASLGAGFGSASADIMLLRIPAHPRGAYIRWGIDTRH